MVLDWLRLDAERERERVRVFERERERVRVRVRVLLLEGLRPPNAARVRVGVTEGTTTDSCERPLICDSAPMPNGCVAVK